MENHGTQVIEKRKQKYELKIENIKLEWKTIERESQKIENRKQKTKMSIKDVKYQHKRKTH